MSEVGIYVMLSVANNSRYEGSAFRLNTGLRIRFYSVHLIDSNSILNYRSYPISSASEQCCSAEKVWKSLLWPD
jgi:hypothetical protein